MLTAEQRAYLESLGLKRDATDAEIREFLQGRGHEAMILEVASREYGMAVEGLDSLELFSRLEDPTKQRRVTGLEPRTVNRKEQTVEVVAATEDPVMMIDWKRLEVVDEVLLMAGLRFDDVRNGTDGKPKIPLLDNHQRDSIKRVLGSGTNLRVEGTELVTDEVWSSTCSEEFTKCAEGHVDQRSLGYRVRAATYVEAGETAVVEGQSFTADANRTLKIATDWYPIEESATIIGADPGAGARTGSKRPQPPPAERNERRNLTMLTAQQRAFLEAMGLKREATDDEIRAFLEGHSLKLEDINPPALVPKVEPTRAAATEPDQVASLVDAAVEKRLAEERATATGIETAFAPWLKLDGMVDLRAECLTTKLTVAEAREKMTTKLAEVHPGAGRVNTGVEDTDHFRANLAAGIQVRCTKSGKIKLDPVKDKDTLERGNDLQNYSLFELARMAVERAGIRTGAMGRMDIVGKAFTMGGTRAGGMNATGDFPIALENVAHKSLEAAYAFAPQSWSRWCQRGSLSDFKQASIVRVGEFSLLAEVPEGAEYGRVTLPEKKEVIYLSTFGDIFSLTRVAVINDDLGAFTDTPRKFGRAWARTVNRQPVALLLGNAAMNEDAVAMFHADHKNLATGAGNLCDTVAKTRTCYKALKLLLRQQTGMVTDDGDSPTLDIQPRVVLIGATYEGNWYEALFEHGRADENTPTSMSRDSIQIVAEPELENTNISGYSVTASYLAADPNDVPNVRVAFLDGNDAPRLESQAGFTVDGTDLKVSGDVGVGRVDYRGMAKANGA